MTARKILICLALLIVMSMLTVAAGCVNITVSGAGPVVIGSGQLGTWDFDYSDFTEIEAGYAFEVDITRADSYLVRITIDNNLREYLNIHKSGDTLHVGLKPNNIYTNVTRQAIITLPDLYSLELSGASQADVSGFITSHAMDFELSGASQMDMSDMKADDTSFGLSGASQASGSIEIDDGTFDLSGASSVELAGSADDVSIEASGASNVRLSDFSVDDTEVNLSGASDASINASGRLDVDLSGGSSLRYSGSPTLGSISTSGGSTVSQK